MAIGDMIGTIASVAAGSYCSLTPSAGDEWVVHNIYHGGDITLDVCSATGTVVFDSKSGSSAYNYFAFHCSEAQYIRVKNAGTASIYIAYDGVKTKD